MTGFAEYLAQAKRPGWSEHYFDYSGLKNLLERFAGRRSKLHLAKSAEDLERFDHPSVYKPENFESHDDFELLGNNATQVQTTKNVIDLKDLVSMMERDEFCLSIDNEVAKCAQFYLEQIEIYDQLLKSLGKELNIVKNKNRSTESEEEGFESERKVIFETYKSKYQELADELLEIFAFVAANITALHQILIRYDGMIRTLDGPPLAQWYIVTRRQGNSSSNFKSLLIHYKLVQIAGALIHSLRSLKDFTQRDEDLHSIECLIQEFTGMMSEMELVVLKTEQTAEKAARGKMAFADNIFVSIRYYFLAGSLMNDLLLQPGFLRTRGRKLRQEIKVLANWRASRESIINGRKNFKKSELHEKFSIGKVIRGPLAVNLVSQFFFMMSHYIIEPSSAKYISYLGGNDALAGLLIGMTPWAALISGFAYSVWSNHSFRQPLICSGVLLAAGSLVYSLASRFQSIPIALVGRFMTGLGAPCTVNRRYIADTVPAAHRTALSAMFVTASAFGMSMGPGTAVLLDFFDFQFNIPLLGQFKFNGMTGPGYLMFILWSFYLVALVLTFEDGERIGLKELAAKHKGVHGDKTSHYQPPNPSPTNVCHPCNAEDLEKSRALRSIFSSDDDDEDSNIEGYEQLEANSKRMINQATIVCMILIYLGKFTLEALNSSGSIVTRHRYDWSIKNVGTLGFVNGMLVIPIATTVGFLSQYYHDRTLITALLCVAFFGVFSLLDFTDFSADLSDDGHNDDIWLSVGPRRFISGQIICFSSLHAFESVAQSALSKVVPLALAQGTFNSGFIVTTLATLGRGTGDVFITLMGLISLRNLLNLLVLPSSTCIAICITLSRIYRHKLSV